MNQFRRVADATASAVGSPSVFSATVVVTAVWLLLGPVFEFSDTWQLSMNTIASQVTFLIALLLQNTQNRDTRALQLKLDELIRSTGNARNHLINLEGMEDAELDSIEQEFHRIRKQRAIHEPDA